MRVFVTAMAGFIDVHLKGRVLRFENSGLREGARYSVYVDDAHPENEAIAFPIRLKGTSDPLTCQLAERTAR